MDATQIIGPFVLFLLMSVVGLELTVDDFRRVAKKPRAVVGGTLSQIVLLPLMTWAVVQVFALDPVFGAGAILVAVAPGAGISNILTALARANAALSVTLTAVASVLAVVALPTIASVGMRVFLDTESAVEIPVGSLVGQLVFMLLVPIVGGMAVRARAPEFADRIAPRVQRGVLVAITLAVVLSAAFVDDEQISSSAANPRAFAAAFAWTLSAMGIGWTTARLLNLSEADRFTFVIEFGARNIAVSAIVALSALGRLDLTFFSGVYMAVGYPIAVGAAIWRRRRTAGADPAEDLDAG